MNTPAKVEGIYPLSASQQGMWVQSVADRSGRAFIEQTACCLIGELDTSLLRQAWQMVVDRHAALRSAFVAKGDAPLQVVMARVPLPLREVECSADEEARQLEHLLASEREEGFTLNRPPLLRAALLRVGAKRHWWAISFHHLILDGWSLTVLWHEARIAYLALATGQRPALPPAPDYRQYVAWLKSRTTTAAETYWRQRLAGFSTATPIADLNDEGQSNRPHRELARQTSPAAGTALAETVRHCRLPAAMLLETLWAILLAGRSGRDDVVFGTTVSGRPAELADAANLIGCFINTVPVRLQLKAEMTLRQCLQAHHEARVTQAEHEYCASGQIQAWSELTPGQPLYASLLVVENLPSANGETKDDNGNLRIGEQRVNSGHSSLPLSLLISPGATPHLRFIYQPQFMTTATVDALARDFERLLGELPDWLDRPLGELLSSIDRVPVAELSQVGARQPQLEYVAPRTRLEHALCHIWENLFDRRDIGVLDDFFALGGHSLMVLQMASRIRNELGFDCPLHTIIGAPSIERLAAALIDQDEGKSALVPLASGGNGTPIYCPHPLGGHVLCYAPLARALAGRHPCWGLQAPGLDEGEPLAASWDELIAHHWRLLPDDNSPLILLGYSYGGYIAMELADRLHRAGRPLPPVVLLDVPHPSAIPKSMSMPDRATLVHSLFGRALDLDLPALQALPPDTMLPQVHALAVARHVLPPGTSLAMLERLLAVAHNASRLVAPPTRSYDFPILLLRAREASTRIADREDFGWRDYVRELTVTWVDGSHESMLEAPRIPGLLEALSGVLSR